MASPLALPQRLITALASPRRPDDFFALFDPLWARETLRARIVGVHRETADATTLTLHPGAGWKGHRAGQFLRVSVSLDGVRHNRCYSISSAPDAEAGRLQITVKAIDDGRVSRHLAHHAKTGDVLDIATAEGDFCWPSTLPEKALFISGGSGITPLMSMARWAAAQGQLPPLTWLHYVPAQADLILAAPLKALADAHPTLDLKIIPTREGGARFSEAALARHCPDWWTRPTWSCGPSPLLGAVEQLWADTPAAAALTVERFRPPALKAGTATGGRLSFAHSGRAVDSDGRQSILEAAEASGLSPAHGCRMGICHGCTVKLRDGQVRDLRSGRCFGEPDDLIQICVCAPAGDVTLDL